MRPYLILIFFSPLLVASNCHKDKIAPAVLPEATQEGKNTIGFLVNGEVLRPYYKCIFSGDPCGEISAYYDIPLGPKNSIDFSFLRSRNGRLSNLVISAVFATVTSPGEKIDSVGVTFADENQSGNDNVYSGIMPGSTFMITKLDLTNQIISGTFKFILSEDNRSGRTIELTDGMFDFKFNACICSN
jgi:hypothetical protein